MRDLVPHEEQCFFADDLSHQLFFRHIGVGVIIKVMGTFHGVTAQSIKQLLAAFFVAHADGVDCIKHTQCLQLCLAGFQIGRVFHKVSLVDDRNGWAAAVQRFHQRHLRFVQRTIGLEQHHGNIHIRNGIAGGLIHALAQLVMRLVHTGSIQQHILQRPPGDHAGNAGACGLGLRGDDGHLLADQEVRQAGFAHVRPSDDSNEYRGGVVMLLNGYCSTQSELLSCFYVLLQRDIIPCS